MRNILFASIFFLFLFSISSCEVAGGIFKAGVWVGVLLVLAIIGLIIFLISRNSNK